MGQKTYFLKRGNQVIGPRNVQQIQQLRKANKVTAKDLVATAKDGPWYKFADVEEKLFPSESSQPQTENEVRPVRSGEEQLVTRTEEFSEISAGQAFLLGMLSFYLAVCLFCGIAVGWGPSPDMSYGAIGGMFFLAPFSLPAGFILKFIILPLSRSVGLSKRAAVRVIGYEIVFVVMIWMIMILVS